MQGSKEFLFLAWKNVWVKLKLIRQMKICTDNWSLLQLFSLQVMHNTWNFACMCLLRRVGVLKCSCNRRIFTDATCTSGRFLEEHHRESMHITHCVCFQHKSYDVSIVLSMNAEWKLRIPSSFPLNWVHTAHLSDCTCSRSARVNFSRTDVFRSWSWSYSAIHFSTALRPTQCFMVGGSCSSLDDGPDWLHGFDVPRCLDILSVQIQFCPDITKNCSDFFWLLDVISSPSWNVSFRWKLMCISIVLTNNYISFTI